MFKQDLWIDPVLCLIRLEAQSRAATILWLLGNETNQFSTRGKKSELGLRKELNIDVKSTTKLDFSYKHINIFY